MPISPVARRLLALPPAVACLLALAGAVPPAAVAADVRIEGSTLVYAASPGVEDHVIYTGAPDGEIALGTGLESGKLTAQAPCEVHENGAVRCPAAGLTSARIELGDRDDTFNGDDDSASVKLASVVTGGDGNDNIFGSPSGDEIDGGPGRDELGGGGGDDKIAGGEGNDGVNAGDGADTVDAGGGADEVVGGDGNDSIVGGAGVERSLSGGRGDDTIDTRDGERENGGVACDEGDDTIIQDRADAIVEFKGSDGVVTAETTCEHVQGGSAPKPQSVFQWNGRAGLTPLRLGIDIVSAFGGRYSIQVLMPKALVKHLHLGKKAAVVAKGSAPYKPGYIQPRTQAKLKFAAKYLRAMRKYRVIGFVATVKIRSADSAGRSGAFTFRAKLFKSVLD